MSTAASKAVPSFFRFDLVVPAASVGACQAAGTRLMLQGASDMRVFGRLRSSPRCFGWQVFEVPPQYLSSGDCFGGSWPIRISAASTDGMFIAVAGATGVAILSRSRRAGGRSKRPYSRMAVGVPRTKKPNREERHSIAQSLVRSTAEGVSERDLSLGRHPNRSTTLLSTTFGSSHRTEGWRLFANEWEEANLRCEGLSWCRRGVDMRDLRSSQSNVTAGSAKSEWALLVVCTSLAKLSSSPDLQQYKILSFMSDNLSLGSVLHSETLPPGHRPVLTAVSNFLYLFLPPTSVLKTPRAHNKYEVLATSSQRRQWWI